jgi:hypothetical protein
MALDDIYASLDLLEQTITSLEQDIVEQEERNTKLMQNAIARAIAKTKAEAASAQIDLFAAPAPSPSSWAPITAAKPANDKNSEMLAQKLDNTIEKVQALLKQAGA